MSKTYTESELLALGLTKEQIDAVANQAPSITDAHNDVKDEKPNNITSFSDVVNRELTKPLSVTSISDLKLQSAGELVQLPGFVEGEDFIARMRRPSLLAMVKKGMIPNSLLSEATELFSNGTSNIGKNKNTLDDMMNVIEIICEASLIEPTWKDIRDNDIELTDEQLMAIFSYSQRGIAGVRQFRNQ